MEVKVLKLFYFKHYLMNLCLWIIFYLLIAKFRHLIFLISAMERRVYPLK